MSAGASWPHWIRQASTPDRGLAQAGPGPWRDRLLQGGGLLLVAALAMAAEWVQNAPALMPPVWLATGAATALAMRWPAWRMQLAIVLALLAAVLASRLLHAPGIHGHSIWHGLAEAVVAATHAGTTALAMQRLWATLRVDHHRLHQVRLVHLFRMVFVVTLPRALLAGALMTALHGFHDHALLDEGAVPWRLGLQYAAASALSILVLSPLLWLGRVGVGPWSTALALTIASAVVVLASLDNGMGLYAMPLLALAAGYLGGIGLASLCCTVMAASLMVGIHHHEMPPFEGPDGFIVQLLFTYRLTATAYLASVWADRRVRRSSGQAAGRGARLHLALQDLAAAASAAAVRQADTPVVLLAVRWHLADPAEASSPRIAARCGKKNKTTARAVRPSAAGDRP